MPTLRRLLTALLLPIWLLAGLGGAYAHTAKADAKGKAHKEVRLQKADVATVHVAQAPVPQPDFLPAVAVAAPLAPACDEPLPHARTRALPPVRGPASRFMGNCIVPNAP